MGEPTSRNIQITLHVANPLLLRLGLLEGAVWKPTV